MDVRTFIKFHMLLGKRTLKCYKSLKEGLGTLAPSYETVCRWVNSVKNDKETDDAPCSGAPTSATHECHMEQVKSVLDQACSTSCLAFAAEVSIFPARVFFYVSSSTTWGNEKFVQSGFHTCSMMTKEPCMFFLSCPICSVGKMKAVCSSVAL
jgi:hypothetical protein